MKPKYWHAAIVVLAVVFVASAFAQDPPLPYDPNDPNIPFLYEPNAPAPYDPNDPFIEDPNLLNEPNMPGQIEGTGTYFEVNDSHYLNITFESSETVHLMLESVPEMVVMNIEAAEGATSTWITLTGFAPSTTYYMYQDDYHNGVAFTTGPNGTYTYTQDLSIPHLVFIQPQPGTRFIPSDTSIGIWDPDTRIYTLTTDVYETIQIDEDDLTLDGAGQTVTSPGGGHGVYLSLRTGVTIQNVNVQGFSTGIRLSFSNKNTLTTNTASNNSIGIKLRNSHNNTLTTNTASNNSTGIRLQNSSYNTLTNNTASNNEHGFYIDSTSSGWYSTHNTLTDNTANSNNQSGIFLYRSSNNTLTDNTANYNTANSNFYGNGIWLLSSSNNTLTGNTASNNTRGIVGGGSDNTFTGNVASNNIEAGFRVIGGNITLTNNTTNSNGLYGIYLYGRYYNSSLTGNTALNNDYGIYLSNTQNSTLKHNTVSNNDHGIYLDYASDTRIFNNNFISNLTQAYVSRGSGNIFNLPEPVAGNYWSDYTGSDANGDGLGDSPYVFTGGRDNLPWVVQDGWIPSVATKQLIDQVEALNLQQGIDNSLDYKLDAALSALDDVNANNDVAAINTMQAFINAVEAQRGGKITDTDADALITRAQRIIDCLRGS